MTHTLRSQRFALISCVVVLGLASCGSRSDIKPAAKPTATPQVIVVGTNTSGYATAPAAADVEAGNADQPAGKMMAPMSITYTYTGDMLDLTAPAPAWFFPTGTTPSKESIAAIAAALGLAGEIVELPADQGGGWMIGDTAYVGANMTVSADAMHSWWYNAPQSVTTTEYRCDVAYAEPVGDQLATEATTPEVAPATTEPAIEAPVGEAPVEACAAPEPPANVPTKEQAEAKAAAFFASIGVDPTQVVYDTYADEWGAYVTAFLTLDGIRSNLSSSIGFGAEGAITWASGFLATPERGGDYPRVGIDAAIQRLNDQNAMWHNDGVQGPIGVSPATADVAISSREVSVGDSSIEPPIAPEPAGTVPADQAFLEPLECGPAVDCVPFGEPITVELINAHPTLEQIYAGDGTVWLVPGYGFDSADQGIYSVIAIDDSFIQVEQAVPVVTPAIIDPPVAIEPPVAIDPPVAVEPAPGAPECPVVEIPTSNTSSVPGPDAADAWIGMCLADAEQFATNVGYILRIVRQDGVDLPVTADFIQWRFNVAVVNGIVTEILSQG